MQSNAPRIQLRHEVITERSVGAPTLPAQDDNSNELVRNQELTRS